MKTTSRFGDLNEAMAKNAMANGSQFNAESLLEKWSPQIKSIDEAFDGNVDDYRLLSTAILLENTSNHLARVNEATQLPDVGLFKKYAINLLSAVTPNLIANDLVSVQPMLSRVGEIRYLKVLYGSNKGKYKKGDEMYSLYHSGSGRGHTYSSDSIEGELFEGDGSTKAFSLAWTPVIPGTVQFKVGDDTYTDNGEGKVVKKGGAEAGTIDYVTGNVTLTAAPANGATVEFDYEYDNITAPVNAPEVDIKIASTPVIAKSRKLKAVYSFDAAFDMSKDYGMAINNELVAYTAAHIKHEIDEEIIADLCKKASAPGTTWNMAVPEGISMADHYASFRNKLSEAGNGIYFKTTIANGSYYIVGEDAANVVESLPGFRSAGAVDPKGPYLCGYLGDKPVYKCPTMAKNQYLVGYKGSSLFDAGYVYCPHMPIMSTQLLMDETFTGKQGFASSYGKKMTNSDFYSLGTITNA